MGYWFAAFGLLAAIGVQLLMSRSLSSGSSSSGSDPSQTRRARRRLWRSQTPPLPPPSADQAESDDESVGEQWPHVRGDQLPSLDVEEYSPSPPLPPLPPLPPPNPQPDEVRMRAPPAAPAEMRCGERIPPESILTTTSTASAVTVFARARYTGWGEGDRLHAWSYTIEFTNAGATSVQLLTRHWVFVDEGGRAEEIKGPGARGQLPVLRPGEKWSYESGTRLHTPRGSMHGWFVFEEMARKSHPQLFSVRVGRLALSSVGGSELVPCASPADAGKLPPTSVHSTDRVIVGAIATVAHRDDDLHNYAFGVDVQVNNARAEPVTIVGIQWQIIDSNGRRTLSSGHVGAANSGTPAEHSVVKMPPNSALRLKATLPQIGTPTAVVSGALLVRFGDPDAGLDAGSPAAGDDDDAGPREIAIASLGASTDGDPVPSYEPLTFLDALPGI